MAKVLHAEWAAPIVVVPKCDGTVHLSGAYKVKVNKELNNYQYLLPHPEDLMTSLTEGQKFSKLDLSAVYQQIPFAEESRQFVTINTHQGLYRYTQLYRLE